MNPYFSQAIAQSRQQDFQRPAQAPRLAADLRRLSRVARFAHTLAAALRRDGHTASNPVATGQDQRCPRPGHAPTESRRTRPRP
jgi:hypothetical protein